MSKVKGIIVEIGGDTSALQKALKQVNSVTSSLSKELRGVNSLLKLDPKNSVLLSQKQKILNDEIAVTSKKLEELRQHEKEVSKSGKTLTAEQKENYRALQREIINTEQKLKLLNAENSKWIQNGKKLQEYGNKIDGVGNRISNLGSKLTAIGTTSVTAIGGLAVKSAIDFESAFTGVKKTVDGTPEQLEKIKQGIKDVAKEVPSTTEEIASVAETAGQLGIETDNIINFTKAMIDLTNSTNLSIDEGASQLAKFENIMGTSQDKTENLGSAIVDLGNNYATTEQDIVSMAMRLAGAGKQVGLSEGDVLGLATGLSSVGVEAEMGGSAFSKAMVKMQSAVEIGGSKLDDVLSKTGMSLRDLQLMSDNDTKSFKELAGNLGMTKTELKNMVTAGAQLKDFASISGMTTEQFKKQWKEDATGAITAFIKGLGNTKKQGKSAIALLQDMGLSEVRLRDSLLRAANSGDLFSKAIKTGNKAFKENTALSKEANQRYKTLESRLKTTKNNALNMATSVGDKLTPTINKLLDKVNDIIKKFSDMSEEELKNTIKIGLMVAATGPLIKVFGTITSGAGKVVKTIGTFSEAIGVMQTGVKSANSTVNGLATVLGGITSPAGIATLAITGTITAMALMKKAADNANKDIKKAFENMGSSASNYVSGIDSAKSHLDDFNRKLFVTSKEQQKLEEQMDKVQNGITKICKTASNERRDYTEKEIKQLDEYFRKLRELNQRELEIEQSISKAITQQATTNAEAFTGSLEEYKTQSQEWIKTAEEQKIKEIELINTQTTEEIALLNQRFGSKADLSNEAYINEYNEIIKNKENRISEANSEVAKVNQVFAEGYQKRVEETDGLFKQLQSYNNKYQEETNRHNQKIQDIESGNFNWILGKTKESQMEHEKYGENTKKIWDEMYKNMSQEQEKELGIWLANIAQTEMYGGQITEENKELVDTIIASYDKMPKDTREAMKNAMTPMLEEMEKKEPSLFSKATSIANGILNRLRKAFDEHSPSKETRSIFRYVMQGAELGLEDEKPNLYSKIDSLAKGTLDKMKNTLEINSPSKKFKDEVGKNIALGVIEGVDSQKKNAKKSAEKLASLYISAAKEKISSLKESNKITEAQEIDFWNTIVNNTKKGTKSYTTALNNLNTAKKNLKKDVTNLTKQYIKDVTSAKQELEKSISDLKNTYNDSVNNRKNEIVNSLNLFDDVNLSEKIDKSTLKANLQNQVNALIEWDKTLDSLRTKIGDSDLLTELEKQGVGSLSILQELNSMSNEELKDYIELYNQKNKIALERSKVENQQLLIETNKQIEQLNKSTEKKINSLTNTYEKELQKLGVTTKSQSKKIGEQITAGISEGMTSGMKDLSSDIKSQLKSLIKQVKKDLKIKSPSRVFRDEVGKYMALGIGTGFDDNLTDVYKKIGAKLNMETRNLSKVLNDVPIKDFGKIQGDLSSKVIENTKTIFTTPQINFYPQQMTEENMKACFNYINRKFGSAY